MKAKYPWEKVGNTDAQNEASRQSALAYWREEHLGQRNPDDAALADWFAQQERRMLKEEWQEAHPDQPLPDDYRTVRRWAIDERNKLAAALAREFGGPFSAPRKH